MNAIRTVSETADVHVIEGLGIPFVSGLKTGKDTYGTLASVRTNFHWDLFPDRSPETGDARYIRPTTFQHGFDPGDGETELGLTRVGGWSPVRSDARGIWVQAQIDKHHAYYDAIRDLLDEKVLAFSVGSAEHSVRMDDRTGEWLDWPAYELALTPTPSNPAAIIAVRAAQAADVAEHIIRIVGTRKNEDPNVGGGTDRDKIPAEDFAGKDRSFPIVKPGDVSDAASSIGRAGSENYSADELKANIIRIAKRKGSEFEAELPKAWQDGAAKTAVRKILTFADIEASAEMDEELPEAFQTLQSAIYSAIWATDADFQPVSLDEKKAAIGQSLSEFSECVLGILDRTTRSGSGLVGTPVAFRAAQEAAGRYFDAAVRAGKRNSADDQARVDAIHDHAAALGASAHAGDKPPDDESNQPDPSEAAARSGEGLPTLRIVERPDPARERAELAALATRIGTETAARLTAIPAVPSTAPRER